MKSLYWTTQRFSDLTSFQLYEILKIRSEVFVVEQRCNYLDPDGIDLKSLHLGAWNDEQLVAYARLIPPGESGTATIGRVLVKNTYRKLGLGKELMERAIKETFTRFETNSIHISAQLYLLDFYSQLGFRASGLQYLEDDIPHIGMDYRREI